MLRTMSILPSPVLTSFRELCVFLGEQNLPHAVNAEAQIIEIPTRSPPLEGTVYIRWEKTEPLVQLIHPLAVDVTGSERVRELEKAICRANNALPLPGFGFDYERGTLYFRLTVPMYAEGMSANTFQRLVLECVKYARDFLVPFRGVLEGLPGDDIVESALAYARGLAAGAES
jgi:hypothetical protein